jgi:hypothetical protein
LHGAKFAEFGKPAVANEQLVGVQQGSNSPFVLTCKPLLAGRAQSKSAAKFRSLPPMLKVRLTPGFIAALLSLMFVTQDVQHIFRALIYRWICGCWSTHGYGVWQPCGLCEAFPDRFRVVLLFTVLIGFVQLWVGYALLSERLSIRLRAVGFALVFAALPLAELTAATLGVGSDAVAITKLVGKHGPAWLMLVVVTIALLVPPVLRAHDAIDHPRRGTVFLALLVGPLLVYGLTVAGVLNRMEEMGLGGHFEPLRTSWLSLSWTLTMLVVLLFTFRHLFLGRTTGRPMSKFGHDW